MTGRTSVLAIVSALAVGGAHAQTGEVNVYTYREAKLIKPFFDAFTAATGIRVNTVSATAGLEQRIAAEGANSPADLLLTVDVGRIQDALALGIAQPMKSQALESVIPARYRDPDGRWYGVSMRARIVYASRERVPQDSITYEELADPKWKGKFCTRSGQYMYSNALFAAYLAHHGEEKTEAWLRGLKANLAQKPSGADREVARDIAAGKCDVGFANTYYWALMKNNEPERQAWADATKVLLATFQGGGTHVNLSAVALMKNAPHKEQAMKLVEFFASEQAQRMYADLNYEYPLRAGVAVNPTIASYGTLKPDTIALSDIIERKRLASTLVDKVGFDQ